MVLSGEADAAAIDSHVLAVALHRDRQSAAQVHVIDTFGPSAIPPVVVNKHLDAEIKRSLRDVLTTMHHDSFAAHLLQESGIERFVAVRDEDYNDIRYMLAHVQSSGFPRAFP